MWFPFGLEERHSDIKDDPTLGSSNLDAVPADLVSSPMNCDLHESLKLSCGSCHRLELSAERF